MLLRSLPAVVALITSVRNRRSMHASSGERAERPYSHHLPPVLQPGADMDRHARRFKMQCASQSEMWPPLRNRLDLEQSGAFARGPQIAVMSCRDSNAVPPPVAMRAVTVESSAVQAANAAARPRFQIDRGITRTRGQRHDSIKA